MTVRPRHLGTGLAVGPVRAAVLLVTLSLVLAVSADAASADPPHITIEVSGGAVLRDATPTLKGITTDYPRELDEPFDPVRVVIRQAQGGAAVQELEATFPTSPFTGFWSVAAAALPDGTYTARAEQTEAAETGKSDLVTFTIDTTPPQVTLTQPADGSSSSGAVTVGGAAGTAPYDSSAVSVRLFAGGAVAQTPLETLVVQASAEGGWSAALAQLAPGTYTVQATQRDTAGNVGASAPASFTVTPPAGPPAPTASFSWVPSTPLVGESVALASSSTDLASPITGFAWALTPSAAFVPGNSLLLTSFSTPGLHQVRLRVTDAAGRSSIATEDIPVKARPAVLMSPFPIVRIAGSLTAKGARINLLTVQAPVSAHVTVLCRGRGCRTKSETRSATASTNAKRKTSSVLLSFGRFQRSYRARTVLTILVSKPERVGKYTTFVIRRHKLPVRTDACVPAGGSTPIPCASS
ncbi:MAG: hypothetical protein QOG40_1460 [Solirubrobacteraceae bacterium]|nr:hypothetical protein [Solirubrobacteraceae bacterium]